jgi:replicative DNA helicase
MEIPETAAKADSLRIEDMSTDAHRQILAAVRLMQEQGAGVNYLSVLQEMKRRGTNLDGRAYLAHLCDGIPRRYDPTPAVREIQEFARRRSVYALCESAMQRAEEGESSVDILHDLQVRALSMESSASEVSAKSIAEFAVRTLEIVKMQRSHGGELLCITTIDQESDQTVSRPYGLFPVCALLRRDRRGGKGGRISVSAPYPLGI